MNRASTASLIPSSSKSSHSQKDYFAALGDLQSQYGMGFHVPNVHHIQSSAPPASTSSKKWYKWRSSSSASSLSSVSSNSSQPHNPAPPVKDYQSALGDLMTGYGGAGAFQPGKI
ncbi:hypothetical protein HYDPIDRAFT_112216 [Hydnomerulius pinastri MD-312]|uniref:Uncharacterized protein n=1 Tax=Hydnomerulius pinastri MD-312 TaxID=994086 RepID=A0A0C9VFH2_9AGAM|nr:hypothetical protein HYDPIDRAFT_112216 [Hydnomerulius pinastri MD-312]